MASISIADARLEYEWIGRVDPAREAIVLLHEGLGSVAMWRDFPARISDATDKPVLVYSRQGYGRSEKLTGPRTVRYMHHEALQVLPALLDRLGLENPILFGHSDGASIALIHAGESNRPVSRVIAMAPHLFVEDISVAGIQAAGVAYQNTNLRERLSRYHDDVDGAFRGWNDIWLSPEFRSWNIESSVAKVRCPVLAIQGYADEYGTMRQVDRIAELALDARLVKLEACGHSPHKDNPDAVIDAVTKWMQK